MHISVLKREALLMLFQNDARGCFWSGALCLGSPHFIL
jgi:hypothetical protein